MKVIVTHLNMGEKPPGQSPGIVESNHVSAILVEEGRLFLFMLSGQQLHILHEKEVYKQLALMT